MLPSIAFLTANGGYIVMLNLFLARLTFGIFACRPFIIQNMKLLLNIT